MAAVLSLGLGIGATTSVFSVVNAVLLTPLPYRGPDRLVTASHFHPSLSNLRMPISAALFRDLRGRTEVFDDGAVERTFSVNLTSEDREPERIGVAEVSTGFFSTLGIAPEMGRPIQADGAEQGVGHVAVVSRRLWQRWFGSDPSVLGRRVALDNEDFQIIGVMPEHFRDFFSPGVEVFTPLVLGPVDYSDDRRGHEYLSFTGRLKPGLTVERAQAEMHAMALRLRSQYPDQYSPDWDIKVSSLGDEATRNIRSSLLLLLGAVGFVLLIACANVANLHLARTATRLRELAIRIATGASPWRVVRHSLTESMVLAVAGGCLGLLLTLLGMPALSSLYKNNLATIERVPFDGRVLTFALLVTSLSGLLFGLLPALQIARTDLHQTLKEGGRATRGHTALRLRRALVVGSVSLAIVLLVGAGLLIRSFIRLVRVDPGFRADHLLSFDVSLPIRGLKYSDTFDRIVAALTVTPGVRSAGGTTGLPLSGNLSPKGFPATRSFNVEGYQPPPNAPGPGGEFRVVTPGFLATIGVRLHAGRQFNAGDRFGTPLVCIVDEEMVRRYWPNADPIGKRIAFGNPTDSRTTWIQVVGVVGHTKQERLDDENRVQVYLPVAQFATGFLAFAVLTEGDPYAALAGVRGAVHSVDPRLPLAHVTTMEQLIARSTARQRFAMLLLGGFALFAVALASIGLYGITSFIVTQRSRELGVRLVLGAKTNEVLRLVILEALRLALVGVVIGLAAALALTRVMSHLLFKVSTVDPLTFLTTALLLVAVAMVASYLPALRATHLNPVEVLRAE